MLFNRDASNYLEFQVYTIDIFLCIMHNYVKKLYSIEWRYSDDFMTIYKFCFEAKVGNKNVNYCASAIARDAMPEPVVINLDSDDDDSLKGTASENENEICLAMK